METRRMISAMLVAIAVFYAWLLLARMIWPQPTQPSTQPATAVDEATSRPAPVSTTPSAVTSEALPATGPASDRAVISGGSDTRPLVLGAASAESPFPMEIILHPSGAVVSKVRLRGHYQTVEKKEPYSLLEPVELIDKSGRVRVLNSFPTTLRVLNPALDVPLDEVVWKVESCTEQQVVFSVDVTTPDGRPLLRVFKTYQLAPQEARSRTSDAQMSLLFENLLGQPVQVIVTQQGPIGFRKEDLRSEDRKVIGAVWRNGAVTSKLHPRANVIKHAQIELGSDINEGTRIAWVAEGNKYFGCIMAPSGRDHGDVPSRFTRAEAIVFAPQVKDDAQVERQDLAFRFITEPITIPTGGLRDLAFDLYMGPKSKRIFESVETYARRSYYQMLSGEFAWCTPGWLVGLMMVLLNGVHAIWPHNYGLSIIVLVLVVKAILHPLSVKGQINMQKMQKSQARLKPKMDAIKEKYANDRARMNQAMAELMKEEGINPAGQMLTCLPMMIQIPIWVALWTALSYTVEMRHAPLDGWWIRDLTQPDQFMRLFDRPVNIPLLGWFLGGPVQHLNILPILLAITQVLQTKFMPRGNPSSDRSPDQLEQQRKMMMFMSVFFMFILYNAPSGLTLYIMASNIFGIVEQWRIRRHIAELEARSEAAKAHPGPLRRLLSKAFGGGDQRKSWLRAKWQELQKEIEQAKRVQSQRSKGKR
ncbi:MAG: YidC/Oxa1 family membrane protein insertase [Phycisphaerae bacterium]